MISVEFTTDLGAKVSVDVDSADQILAVQRQYGRLGWTSGEVPAGGYQFPFDNSADFDWSLIGARPWTNPEGEELVIHKGLAYKRRELEAVDSRKMKLPAAVKYSRGARSTDPEHVQEQADGDFRYVTLCIFRGGKRQDRYAVPGQTSGRGAQPATAATAAARPAGSRFAAPRPTAATTAPNSTRH